MATKTTTKTSAARRVDSERIIAGKQVANFVAEIVNTIAKPDNTKINIPSDWGAQVRLANKIRNLDASGIIDFMVSSANSGVEISASADLYLLMDEIGKKRAGEKTTRPGPKSKSKKIDEAHQQLKAVCDYWAENVNGNVLCEEPGLDRLNETFFEEIWGGSGLWVAQYVWETVEVPGLGSFSLPMRVVVHNPEVLEINYGATFGQNVLKIGYGAAAMQYRTDKTNNVKFQYLKGNKPTEIKADVIIQTLPGKRTYHQMPTPYLMRVADLYQMKRQLYESDYDITENLLAAMLLLREGVPEEGVEREVLENLAANVRTIMSDIKTNQQRLRYFVSGPNTKADWIVPPTDTLLSAQKYFQISVDFLSRLGIIVNPPFNESSGTFKAVSLSPLIQNIEAGRLKCKRMNERFMHEIMLHNPQFAALRPPNVKFKRMSNLEDPQKIKMFIQNAFDRGLPWKYLADEYGLDLPDIIKNAQFEHENGFGELLQARPTFRQQSDGAPQKGEQPKPDESTTPKPGDTSPTDSADPSMK